MAMSLSELTQLLQEAFPQSDVEIVDLAGDGDHYAATIHSPAFRNKTRVQQHQMVYKALKGRMGNILHALALTTGAK